MVFVAGRTGVFLMGVDAPGIWTRFGTGLPEAPVFDLDYDIEDDVLVAGTLGRGAWLMPDVARGAAQPVTLTASPSSISGGVTVTASWSGIPAPTATDWIGLYRVGAANADYIDWLYVSCSQTPGIPRASGSCPFPIPEQLAAGTYELRLLASDSFSNVAVSNPLTLSTSTSLLVSPAVIPAGGTVVANWNGIPAPTATDWIGLYRVGAANADYIDWLYVSCSQTPGIPRASGSCPFPIPHQLPAGTYELRLLASDGFSVLAISNAFTVTTTAGQVAGFTAGGTRPWHKWRFHAHISMIPDRCDC